MDDAASRGSETPTLKSVKDKTCKYCRQAFTSSSLGRHLDLYIRERNPKLPDGIHDVHEIRALRGNITRRQPRGLMARRDTSTPAATPAASRRSPASDDAGSSAAKSPAQPRDGKATVWPFTPSWQATGVMNDIPPKTADPPSRPREPDAAPDSARRPLPQQRVASRQNVAKAQFDMRLKFQDAMDTSKAAELALRELISSWRAAKQFITMDSMPFDFDPTKLDFPALTLQCLQAPPTLFSLTQHATKASWSISPPGPLQYEALQAYFSDEFHKWKITCAAATTTVFEDLPYPPSAIVQQDGQEALRRAERITESLERQVGDHLRASYGVWDRLSAQKQSELWMLEMARSIGRSQQEADKLKDAQHRMKQELANLKTQIEQLNRLQQPREFKIFSPTTIPVSEAMLQLVHEEAVEKGRRSIGLCLDDRNLDLGAVVAKAIDRWKNVIVSVRQAGGMNAQRQLDQQQQQQAQTPTPTSAPASAAGPANPPTPSPAPGPPLQQLQQASQATVPTLQQPPRPRQRMATTGSMPDAASAAADRVMQPATAPAAASPTGSANTSDSDGDVDADADADAEMEDGGGFAAMNALVSNPPPLPMQQAVQLEVSRTRGHQQQSAQQRISAAGLGPATASYGFSAVNTAKGRGAGQVNLSRSMPSMNAANLYSHHASHPDVGITLKGEPMYMD